MFILTQDEISKILLNNSRMQNFEDDYWAHVLFNEFLDKKYLVLRAGHNVDLIQPIPKKVFVKTKKKDRKLIIFGKNKKIVSNFCKNLYFYRPPSVYTGKGIKYKYAQVVKKAGKKDKQKGKSF